MKKVYLFSDGACRGNPGVGGWGVVSRYNDVDKEYYGAEKNTTNNRMELMAAIKGLEALTEPCDIVLTTDSKYVKNGMTQWLWKWKQKNWKTANNTPVKNQDLWQRLDKACKPHKVCWQWVKGHNDHADNEHADRLANLAIDELLV